METPGIPSVDSGELDPAVVALLQQLWEVSQEPAAAPWSLAKLSKQSGLPMSTLRRVLTQLAAAGLAEMREREDGRASANLSAAGRELCGAIFGTPHDGEIAIRF